MKGWPLLRAILTLFALLLAGLPLRSLTRETSGSEIASPPPTSATEKISIGLTFTQPPEKFALKFLGNDILTGGNSGAFDASVTIDAHFPPEGIDLVFDGTWPEYFRKIGVSVRVNRADGSEQTQTLWGKKNIFELLTFSGKHASP